MFKSYIYIHKFTNIYIIYTLNIFDEISDMINRKTFRGLCVYSYQFLFVYMSENI